MNVEVEIKIKTEKFIFDRIKKKLPEFGKIIKSIKQIDEYYVPYHRDFFAKKPCPDEWLRIRINPDGSVFEYDKSFDAEDGQQDYADEYETEVSNPDELRKILEFLDFKKVVTVNKQREYWDCENFEISLDIVKNLGYFIEVEAKGNFENTKKAREMCANFLIKLGIKDYQKKQIKTGYPVLLLKLKNK